LDSLAVNFGELRISLLTVVKGVVTLAILLWAASVSSRFLERRISRVPDLTPSIQVLLGKLLKITLITLAVVVALNSVGIDLTALALFSGAVGVGIGFGLQKVVSNLISGVILLLDKSIKPGDVIELGETFGWISSLGARYVSVVTRDGKEYLIPNEDLITQRVVNWSFTNELVRMEITFGVSYDCDPHEVRRIAREAAARPPRVAQDTPPVCHLTGFGDSSLDFVLRFWIRDPQGGVMNVKGEVMLAVWDAFKEHGIEIPYPHRQLLIKEPLEVRTRERPAEG
jgi:small-conductance mechanosensitive channel